MIKVWRFLSISIIVAVCLGLMLVPAPTALAAADDCGIEVQPALRQVGFNETFSVNVTIDNSAALPLNSLQVFLSFDNSMLQVNSITYAGTPFSFVVLGPSFNNATGEISFNTGTPPGTNTTATAPYVMTINMESKSTLGDTTIAFQMISPTRHTKVYGDGLGDVLNWTRVVNGTVRVGPLVLTVNVTPADTGNVTIDAVTPPSYPNTTNRSWNEVVNLTAVESVPNWTFTHWSGDLTGSDNTTNITMDWDKNVTAHFVLAGSTATLEGNVSFSGVSPGSTWVRGLEVRFFNSTTGNETAWSPMNATTNSTGVFNISGLETGTYNVSIKNWTCLSEVNTSVALTAGNTTVVYFGTTREGDANNNDWVVMADLSLLLPAWNTDTGAPAYDVHYDFNRDGWVTMADLSLMLPNWNQHGDLV